MGLNSKLFIQRSSNPANIILNGLYYLCICIPALQVLSWWPTASYLIFDAKSIWISSAKSVPHERRGNWIQMEIQIWTVRKQKPIWCTNIASQVSDKHIFDHQILRTYGKQSATTSASTPKSLLFKKGIKTFLVGLI